MPFTVKHEPDQRCVSYVTDGVSRLSTAKQASVLAQAASYIAGAPTAMNTLDEQVINVGRENGRYPCLQADGAGRVSALQAIVNS